MSKPLIIVPFRDAGDGVRYEHLRVFKEHMKTNKCENNILIVEQSKDNRKFNRGALLNIGARLAVDATSFIFHDVDLLPSAKVLEAYKKTFQDPIHYGSLWTSKYTHKTFCGGVLYITRKDLERINGFPNKCWGWGGEDDIVRNRLHGLTIPIACGSSAVTAAATGSVAAASHELNYIELSHEHQGHNPLLKNMHRWEDVEQWSNDLSDGFSNARFQYTVIADGHVKVHIL